jgi:sugar O-acyltransferase (sialic acid O-acetyltransferase NeuD family)
MHTNFSIIGTGGHAKVVIESLNFLSNNLNINIFDENKPTIDLMLEKYPINLLNNFEKLDDYFHVAIGSNEVRARIIKSAIKFNKKLISIIHDQAIVQESALVKDGVFLAANSIIASGSIIDIGCIINHASIIDHDCIVGEYSHIAPNSTLGGGVIIGKNCLIGSGSSILPGISIGNRSIIGAGSVVTKDVPRGSTYVGNPAIRLI